MSLFQIRSFSTTTWHFQHVGAMSLFQNQSSSITMWQLTANSRFRNRKIMKPESERSNWCRYNTVKSQCTPTADCRRYAWQIFGSKSATFGSVDNATDTCNRRTTHAREATTDPQLGLLSKCCSSSSRASRSRKSRDCKRGTRWSAAACC